MKPVRLKPAFKDYIWGGTRLRTDFGKDCDFDRVAESWELSCHKDGPSIVENGEYAGLTLPQAIEKAGKGVLGSNCERFKDFPILIKLIDAKDNLSVQVHPDNDYAQRVEGEFGKTEMWYVVDADEGAQLLYGFKKEISKEEFRACIRDNTLLDVVSSIPVKKGDVFFIDAGTLHAIGKGILIAEIQQNSNTTYRVYDYGRVGNDGKPRPLHVDKAVDVTKLCPPARKPGPAGEPRQQDGYVCTRLASCEYFTVDELKVAEKAALCADSISFHALLCLSGDAKVVCAGETLPMKKGDSLFLPADSGDYVIEGACEVILSRV